MDIRKLKPKLRFKNFSENWTDSKFEKYFKFKNGVNASKESYGNGYKFINVLDIINNRSINYENILGKVNIEKDIFEDNKVEFGDVLFQRSSETREEVGQANIYTGTQPVTFGGFVIMGKMQKEYDPFFMNYILKSSEVRKDITSRSGGSTRYNIGQESLKKVTIKLPALEEQRKIASFLSSVDSHIENLKKQKESLEKYKKGMMQKIFNQEVRFKDKNGTEFPEWKTKRLNEISQKYSSNLSASSLGKNEGNYKVYGATGYIQNINFYKQDEQYISIVKDGAGVGRVLLCEEKSSVLGTLDIIVEKDENELGFIYYCLNQINFAKFSIGSTIPHIYFKDYGKLKILVPKIGEQKRIVSFLSSQDRLLEVKQEEIKKTQQWKKGLLQQLFI